MNEREPIAGAVLVVKTYATHSEVHDWNCPVINGEIVAGQIAYDALLPVPVAVLEDPERLARALRALGPEPKAEPCCIDEGEDNYAYSLFDDLEAALGARVRRYGE
jgi:hypothetical protein